MFAPIFQEIYVITALTFHQMAIGHFLAYPAPLLAGITGNNTDVNVSKDEASWIVSSASVTGALGYFVLPPVMQIYGRRWSNILNNLVLIVGSVVTAVSPNITTLVVGQCIQGLGFSGLSLNFMMSAEYSHPKRRSFILIVKNIATCSVILLCHTLGFTLSWRQMAWLGAIYPTISATSTVFWTESPSWLAFKERYDDCVEAFEALRGKDPESRKEMRFLIAAQRQISKNKNSTDNFLNRTVNAFYCKDFLEPLAILTVVETLAHMCGICYMSAYVVDIMHRLSEDQSMTFYYTVGLDVLQVLAFVISSALIRLVKVRTLLLYVGSFACFILSLFCTLSYLNSVDVLNVKWLTPSLLIFYSFLCGVGITPVWNVVTGELFPLKYKSTGACTLGILYCALGVSTLKFTSNMLDLINVHGTFTVYLVISLACLIILFFFMPETKGRTLQDIELDFINITLEEQQNEDQEITFKLTT